MHHVPEVPVEVRKDLQVCFTKQGKYRKSEAKMPHKKEEGTVAIETRGKVKRKAQYPEEGKRQGVLDRMYHKEKGRQAAGCI